MRGLLMVIFDSQSKVFYLHTKNTTYAMGVFKDSILTHLYWGKRLNNNLPENILNGVNIFRTLIPYDLDGASTNLLPQEYSTYGSADFRNPAFMIEYDDGSTITKPIYLEYTITKGKNELAGLPSLYVQREDDVETLTIHLLDSLKSVDIYLSYTVFEELDVITRSTKIVNNGDEIKLQAAMSACVDFLGFENYDLIHLDGAWGRERALTRNDIVYGNQNIESRYGVSSAIHNPFIAICEKNTNETSGQVYGFSLVYSGNFTAGVELDAYNTARAYIGINPFKFCYKLSSGESFQTPEAVLVYSANGLGEMSRIYHRVYRTRLCRGKYRDAKRNVLLNSWEATYYNFDEDKLVEIAKKAARVGVDTFVLDDGWFRKKDDDTNSLGDWSENFNKLPNGLEGLVTRINELGLNFGLWFEPEMVNPDSDLFRKHPDWVLHTKGRVSSLSRNQLTLDLTRKDVCDYIVETLSNIFKRVNIKYVKWDMNRYMTEAGSVMLSSEQQGEVMHRYILGLYSILETLTTKYPNILFECCASGGGRFDPGMLYYMPQVWTSDNSDALDRLYIQYGTSLVYPYSAMSAHVSACPNHQVGRTEPFEMRCNVALPGQFGFELDFNKCTDEELETASTAIKQYEKLQPIFHNGNCYRLKSPYESNVVAVQFVSEDGDTIICCIYSKKATANAPLEYIKLYELDAKSSYIIESTGEIYGGDFLMNMGLAYINDKEFNSEIKVFKKIKI